jgi:hypothetical protein
MKSIRTNSERRFEARQQYYALCEHFVSTVYEKWPAWVENKVASDGTVKKVIHDPGYLCFPVYADQFQDVLYNGLKSFIDVHSMLDHFFPEPDLMDCNYLDDLLFAMAQREDDALLARRIYRATEWLQAVKDSLDKQTSLMLMPSKNRPGKVKDQLDDCLTQVRFPRVKLDELVLKTGLATRDYETGACVATEGVNPGRWAALRAALESELLFKKVSHTIAARVFKEAYGANVGKTTMNYTPEPEGTSNMSRQDEFFYQVKSMLPSLQEAKRVIEKLG